MEPNFPFWIKECGGEVLARFPTIGEAMDECRRLRLRGRDVAIHDLYGELL